MPDLNETRVGLPQSPEIGRSAIDFSQMTPQELVTVGRYAIGTDDAEESKLLRTLSTDFDGDLSNYLETLPVEDPQRAHLYADAVSQSPLSVDRIGVRDFFGALTKADHDVGIQYWQRLATDPDRDVRYDVSASIDPLRDDDLYERTGLSRLEAHGLLRLIEQVDNGERRTHSIGEAALRKLVSLQPGRASLVETPDSAGRA
jgi:hypothetical protein